MGVSKADNDLLLRLASDIADRTPIDWDAIRREHPELDKDLGQLARLEQLAAGYDRTGVGQARERSGAVPDPALFTWGPLRVIEKIGEGSFGEVYRAFDPHLERDVALKLRGPDPNASARRFLDEARAQARVRHPNVLVIHGADLHDGRVGLWTDLVPGETLEARLQRSEPFSAERAAEIGVELCRALSAVHRAALVHGDLTTRNVMQDRDGRVLLMDFGSSSDQLAGSSSTAGTPLFLAPEILKGQPGSPASDLYALGVLLFRLVTKRYPVQADSIDALLRRHEAGEPNLDAVAAQLPPDLADIVTRALDPDPSGRFPSAAAFETALAALLQCHAGDTVRIGTRTAGNLAAPTSSFVGRNTEIDAVRAALEHTRVVTLFGAGGCGKSRLATEALLGMGAEFPDGVWMIELAPVASPTLVPHTVVRELGLRESPGTGALELLLEHLRTRRLALLLDNCEHVLDACARLAAEVSRACPDVRVVATSREALGIAGETRLDVRPLAVPDTGVDAGALERVESVRLFLDRARVVDPGFRLAADNADAIAGICRRLDGIPLALELAASRVRNLEPRAIAEALKDRFDLIAAGKPGRTPHHRTLETLIAWSYDMLPPREQSCLARLSVFAGGWSVDAAEAVCGGDGIEPEYVIDTLAHLADKSLIVRERAAEDRRYGMLETIRAYARGRLLESDGHEGAASRHLGWFSGLAGRAAEGFGGADQEHWLRVCTRDHDNFRAALDHAMKGRRIERGARLASSLWRFWDLRGHWSEALAYYEALAGHDSAGRHPTVRAGVLHDAARIAYRRGDLSRARGFCEEAIGLMRNAGDTASVTRYLNTLGVIESTLGRLDVAIPLHEESLEDARTANDERMIVIARGNLAILYGLRGEFDRAREHYAEMLPVWRSLGDQQEVARTLSNLGHIELTEAQYDRALEYLAEAEALQREISDPGNLAETLLHQAYVAREQGDAAAARAKIDEALKLAREVDHRLEVARAQELLGALETDAGDARRAAELIRDSLVARREAGEVANVAASIEAAALLEIEAGDPLRALALFAATEALRRSIGWIRLKGVADRIGSVQERLKQSLGSGACADAAARGSELTGDAAADFAAACLDRIVEETTESS